MNEFKPMSLKDGRMFINGREVMSGISLTVVFTPQTSTYRLLGNRTDSTKLQGGIFSGTMVQYKANKYWTETIKDYVRTGVWPRIDLQGVLDDPTSDFVQNEGSERKTITGIVPTGDINMFMLDTANNDNVQESIAFNAQSVI